MTGNKAQKGFTLIEVSLAIVIGVIVLAGAITLYNQTKTSAGNTKAGEKTLALASLVEEMGASNYGVYPSLAQITTLWGQRREDARANPWGGNLTGSGIYQAATLSYNPTGTGAGYDAPLVTDAASVGQMVYIQGSGPTHAYDANSLRTATYSNYVVGVFNAAGQALSFVAGGK